MLYLLGVRTMPHTLCTIPFLVRHALLFLVYSKYIGDILEVNGQIIILKTTHIIFSCDEQLKK